MTAARSLTDHAANLVANEGKKKTFPGVHPRVFEQLSAGLDMSTLIQKHDVKGRYRRPCFDKDGKPTGAYDESVWSTRHHFDYVGKGFELMELVPDEPASTSQDQPGRIKF